MSKAAAKNTPYDELDDAIEYPVRLNRYLYLKGYCSRRQADTFIKEGRVKINGKHAVLGQKVEATDHVEIGKSIKKLSKSFEYFVINKPRGVVSHNPQLGEKEVEQIFKKTSVGKHMSDRVFPIGRLDKDSEGLMLLTNDRRIVDTLLNPKYDHEKEYLVTVDKEINNYFKRRMEFGVNIEGYVTKPCTVFLKTKTSFSIILTEGKKHQIRRMCAALGFQVQTLKRTRMMHINLGRLKTGQARTLTPSERIKLLKQAGLWK